MRTARRLAWAWLLLGVAGCRSADMGTSDVSDVQVTWYDQSGKVQACEHPPEQACTVYKDQKSFVDTCVAGGLQAKTCGCLVVCSGKVPGFGLVDDQAALAADAAGPCAAADRQTISAALTSRVAGSSFDRCLASHVCNGNLGLCSGSDKDTSLTLRSVARRGCASQVLAQACPEGYQETLACPEPTIATLSRAWDDMQGKDLNLMHCVRNVVCGGHKANCSSPSIQRANALRQAINTDGCEYWLRTICAIGPRAGG